MAKPTVLGETVYDDGTAIETLSDGTTRHIDKNGNPINNIVVTEIQVQEWLKLPKEKAMKVALEMFNGSCFDVQEAKYKLEVFKILCDISGAKTQAIQTQNIISVKIHVAPLPPGIKPIDVKKV